MDHPARIVVEIRNLNAKDKLILAWWKRGGLWPAEWPCRRVISSGLAEEVSARPNVNSCSRSQIAGPQGKLRRRLRKQEPQAIGAVARATDRCSLVNKIIPGTGVLVSRCFRGLDVLQKLMPVELPFAIELYRTARREVMIA